MSGNGFKITLGNDARRQMLSWADAGVSIAEIARRVGCHYATARDIIQKGIPDTGREVRPVGTPKASDLKAEVDALLAEVERLSARVRPVSDDRCHDIAGAARKIRCR
jgi:transposase